MPRHAYPALQSPTGMSSLTAALMVISASSASAQDAERPNHEERQVSAAAVTDSPPPASAEVAGWVPRDTPRVAGGVELGLSGPGGTAEAGFPQGELGTGLLFGATLVYRLQPELELATWIKLTYQPWNSRECPEDGSCHAWSGRWLLGGAYHLLGDAQIDPWIGLGAGIEIMALESSRTESTGGDVLGIGSGTRTVSVTHRRYGPLISLRGGVDLRLSRILSLGGVLSLGAGRYLGLHTATEVGGDRVEDDSRSVDDPGTHLWMDVTIRMVIG